MEKIFFSISNAVSKSGQNIFFMARKNFLNLKMFSFVCLQKLVSMDNTLKIKLIGMQ